MIFSRQVASPQLIWRGERAQVAVGQQEVACGNPLQGAVVVVGDEDAFLAGNGLEVTGDGVCGHGRQSRKWFVEEEGRGKAGHV